MRLTLNQTESAFELKPGEYRREVRPDLARIVYAEFNCPRCMKVVSIGKAIHTVALDGSCYPGVKCPHDPCRFVAVIELTGWNS